MISKDTDIDNPEKVKEYIASKKTSNTYKEGSVQACALIDSGFEYVTDMDGAKLFRKRN